jgi:hypothetical protein
VRLQHQSKPQTVDDGDRGHVVDAWGMMGTMQENVCSSTHSFDEHSPHRLYFATGNSTGSQEQLTVKFESKLSTHGVLRQDNKIIKTGCKTQVGAFAFATSPSTYLEYLGSWLTATPVKATNR